MLIVIRGQSKIRYILEDTEKCHQMSRRGIMVQAKFVIPTNCHEIFFIFFNNRYRDRRRTNKFLKEIIIHQFLLLISPLSPNVTRWREEVLNQTKNVNYFTEL